MVLVVELNRTWQMAKQVCFNTAKIVIHVQGVFGNKLLMAYLSARNRANSKCVNRFSVILNVQSAQTACR